MLVAWIFCAQMSDEFLPSEFNLSRPTFDHRPGTNDSYCEETTLISVHLGTARIVLEDRSAEEFLHHPFSNLFLFGSELKMEFIALKTGGLYLYHLSPET